MNRIALLRSAILKAKQAYYFGSNEDGITDAEYDALEDELKKLSPDDPVLSIVGAPVPADHMLEKAQHFMHMGSQDKVNTEAEMREWISKRADDSALHCSLKGDGGSAAAYFTNGRLTKVISRGDGVEGEDITAAALKYQGLPAYAVLPDGTPFTGSVRFEVILDKKAWEQIGGKNPRNMGNGIMGRKDGTQAEYLRIYAFDITGDLAFERESQKCHAMEAMGFNVMPWILLPNADAVVRYYNQTMADRGPENSGSLPFHIDGIVVKIDSLDRQMELGMSPDGKYSKGQVAWKPEADGAITTLLDCVLSYGHTGAILPNGRLVPVEIGGTTVSRVLLNNWEEIARLDIAVGDTVKVIKANDIVPKVIQVIDRPANRKPIVEPTNCPICGGVVGRKETKSGVGAITVCTNPACPAKHEGKLKTFIKKVDILGIGDAVREAMREQLGINTAADLYRLGRDISEAELAGIVISGNSNLGGNAAKIIEQINTKRSLPLHIFLGSLGIEALGRREVEIAISKAPDELSTLADWRSDKLRDPELQNRINAPGKAEKWAAGIEANAALIDALLQQVTVVEPSDASETPSVASETACTVCITGTLPSGKKKAEYRAPLAARGFTLVDDVSADLGFLVVADPAKVSNKTEKVQKYNAKGSNIKIIGEDQLVAMIQ